MQITDSTICLADVSRLSVFNFYGSIDLAEQDKARANSPQFQDFGRDYRVMKLGEFLAIQRQKLLGDPLIEIDEAAYTEALEVLPPLEWHAACDGVVLFLMSEFYTGSYTKQYANVGGRYGGRYFMKMVDARDKSTWITAKEIEATVGVKEGGAS